MTYAETTTTADALTVGQFVRSITDPAGISRVYGLAPNVASAVLPSVKTVTVVSAVDGAFGGTGSAVNGQVKVTLTPATTDTVNASSPMQISVPPKTPVTVATG